MLGAHAGNCTRAVGHAERMGWAIAIVVFGVLVVLLLSRDLRDVLRYRRILRLRRNHAWNDALSSPRPLRAPYAAMATMRLAEVECILGRYQRCLDMIDEARLDATTRAAFDNADEPHFHRLVALIGLGQYREVLQLTSTDRLSVRVAHLRAQAFVELGLDQEARGALRPGEGEPLDAAGADRIAGDLLIRRGRIDEGRQLVERALARYEGLTEPGVEVDRGYCLHHLAEAAFAEGDLARAGALADEAIAATGWAPTNAPGLSFSNLFASRVASARGDLAAARHHLDAGRRACLDCEDPPPLLALVERATGDLAVAERARDRAVASYRRAVELFRSIGAALEADEVQHRLDELD